MIIIAIGVSAWWLAPRAEHPATETRAHIVRPPVVAQQSYEQLPVGQNWNWTADTAAPEEIRQAGPYVLRITKKRSDELVSPVASITYGGDTVRVEGESGSATFEHRLAVVQNIVGAPPIILFQSFSGGAHCCNHVRAIGTSGGKLKVIDLGSWDGDYMPLPTDITGDGVADFVFSDNRFLYAFASYAQSYSPTSVYNLIGGQMRDVSKRPAYRKLYSQDFTRAGEVCRTGSDGLDRNGACPTFVAAAARLGRLEEAWPVVLSAYDASVDWVLPTGCSITTSSDCPESAQIHFKSYPEALLAFLKDTGYVDKAWKPKADSNIDIELDEPSTFST